MILLREGLPGASGLYGHVELGLDREDGWGPPPALSPGSCVRSRTPRLWSHGEKAVLSSLLICHKNMSSRHSFCFLLFFFFKMTYLAWFEFVGTITLNWLILPLCKVQKSSCINMSFDWIYFAFRDDKSSVSWATNIGNQSSACIWKLSFYHPHPLLTTDYTLTFICVLPVTLELTWVL